jgi:hypothetical protein
MCGIYVFMMQINYVKISCKEDVHICCTNIVKKMEQNLHETTSRWKTYGKRLFSEDLEIRDIGAFFHDLLDCRLVVATAGLRTPLLPRGGVNKYSSETSLDSSKTSVRSTAISSTITFEIGGSRSIFLKSSLHLTIGQVCYNSKRILHMERKRHRTPHTSYQSSKASGGRAYVDNGCALF